MRVGAPRFRPYRSGPSKTWIKVKNRKVPFGFDWGTTLPTPTLAVLLLASLGCLPHEAPVRYYRKNQSFCDARHSGSG